MSQEEHSVHVATTEEVPFGFKIQFHRKQMKNEIEKWREARFGA